MKKRASSIDVAHRANVSQATVSYVLSGRADKAISEDTRDRVFRAAKELGYMPNRLADGILRGKTSTIGVLMPDFGHSFNAQLLKGLEEAFAESGYRILIAHSRNEPEIERKQVRMLMEQRVDGLVVSADEHTIEEMPFWVEDIRPTGVPLVILDDLKLDGKVDTVVTDDVIGAREAIQHLVDLGHRRIAYIGGGGRASSARDRIQGYREGLVANGIHPSSDLVVGASYYTDEDPDLRPVLELSEPPTAIFSSSDGLLWQAIARLEEAGGHLPESIALVGYGNLEWARYIGLTSVNQNPSEMGRRAAQRLIWRLEGAEGAPMTERLPVNLVVRRSSRRSA